MIYTAEPFANDGSVGSDILKALKRVMAAEFSRELSAKVIHAQRGLHQHGYWQGGAPGYGLRRSSVGPAGEPGAIMGSGQQKAFRGYRTRLVPGPEDEVATVRRIHSLFLVGGLRMVSIACLLNEEGVTAEDGAHWTRQRIRNVLTNEKYAGVLVGGKSEGSLQGVRRRRRRSDWVRVAHGLEPLVDRVRFDLVQAQLRRPKHKRPSDDELLNELRLVLAEHGRLSGALIDRHLTAHCAGTYKNRFGSLEATYQRVGYAPSRRQQVASENARHRRQGRFQPRSDRMSAEEGWARLQAHLQRLGRVSSNTIAVDPTLPCAEWFRVRFGSMEAIYEKLGYEPSERQRFHIELSRPGAGKYRRPR